MEYVLLSTEIDTYTDSMKCYLLEDIGRKQYVIYFST